MEKTNETKSMKKKTFLRLVYFDCPNMSLYVCKTYFKCSKTTMLVP